MTQEHLPPPKPSDPLPLFLSTEHWSLLGTRSMTWSEIMSRINILLTLAGAGLVVLALVSQSSGFGTPFWVMAIGLDATVLVLGTLTGIRVAVASQEDAQMVLGMNRIRAAYLRLAPELEEYLTSGATDDETGLMRTYTLGAGRPTFVHVIGSTNFFLGTVNSILAGVLGTLVTHQSGGPVSLTWSLGIVAGLAYFAATMYAGFLMFRMSRAPSRFPSSE